MLDTSVLLLVVTVYHMITQLVLHQLYRARVRNDTNDLSQHDHETLHLQLPMDSVSGR